MRPFVISGGVLLALALSACGGGSGNNPYPIASATATYRIPPEKAVLFETTLSGRPLNDGGHFTIWPIGYRTGVPYIIGTHAEFDATGAFTEIRIIVENNDADYHTFSDTGQLLITSTGTYAPDYQAMNVERQPPTIQIGRADRLEFDLLWDIPKNAKVRAIRFIGDPPYARGVTFPLPTVKTPS